MKKFLLQFTTLALCSALFIPSVFAVRTDKHMLQVGLAYGSGALTAANLENNTGYGEGYRFGYFDEELEFEELAYTQEDMTKVTVLKAQNTWFYYSQSSQSYVYSNTDNGGTAVGCFHIQLPWTYSNYEDAKNRAQELEDCFVAWIDGEYQIRMGSYLSKEEALNAIDGLGVGEVVGTSSYAVTVIRSGTDQILFQFDGGSELALGIMPDVTGEEDVRTWFKGFRYHGGFRYERVGGGNLNVVNIVDMETYVKGVIPYEMNNGWPLEALKAQAVCARSYAYNCIQERSHASYNVDICTTECCQVYHGVGSRNSSYQANERTDQAVDETEGMYALYDGEPIWAYYSSSHGGGSERIDRVWSSNFAKFPYICGVNDPYEQLVAHLNSYSYWKKTFTKADLLQRLQANGYGYNTSIDSLELSYSEFGNVIGVKVNYTNGKSNSFTPKGTKFGVRSLFGGLSSLHFTINGQGASSGTQVETTPNEMVSGGITVNEQEKLDLDSRLYVLTGTGRTARIDPEEIYVVTGNGEVGRLDAENGSDESGSSVSTPTQTVVTITGNTYVLEGSGNGHQLGMSQYGAYAMAEEGFDYDEIVEFYYPGVEVDFYQFN